GLVPGDLSDGVADLVVVLDRVLGLVVGARLAAGAGADAQQGRIEMSPLGFGVDLEERREPRPDRGERLGVAAIDLLQDREQAALLVVVDEDELGDVHRIRIRDRWNWRRSLQLDAAAWRPLAVDS